jgi:hypothetical protein
MDLFIVALFEKFNQEMWDMCKVILFKCKALLDEKLNICNNSFHN